LSDEVDQSKIKASLDQGVLTIDLPKAEKAKPKRIEVKTS
jgi:HSP20 family molecular chaperone IbpA